MKIDWPLDNNYIRRGLSNNTFGMVRTNANGTKRAHQGWDFYAPVGTLCHAVADGNIALVTTGKDYGLTVVQSFEHEGDTLYAAFCHLSIADVMSGQSVKIGQVIGKSGTTGNAKGMKGPDEHLHFEVRTKLSVGLGLAGRVSPLKIFGAVPLKEPTKRMASIT